VLVAQGLFLTLLALQFNMLAVAAVELIQAQYLIHPDMALLVAVMVFIGAGRMFCQFLVQQIQAAAVVEVE
jgi:hypothetical protein